ncbi:MAG: LytTR family DNA-binding domain-containing protein [Sulfurimonadaceae bacterium]|jgi:two-component system LytT family response regulator|nr:LytTR family DNA-binding domain-containing protein [Sulfurimonadaceae bacterium]
MKIIIVDDETLARTRLLRMLHSLGYSDLHEASDAQEAQEMLKSGDFTIIFLDINMPKKSGLELGYELRYEYENLAIIFQTAYEEHALKAYDIGAIGYLVKPYSTEQLQSTLERVIKQSDTKDFRLLSKYGDNNLLLRPDEIDYIKADLSEVMLRCKKGFSYYGKKISELEKKLEPYGFFRVHRSYLINVNEIKDIQTIEQSKLRFTFKNNSDIVESSKDGAKLFRERFGEK